MKTIEDAVARVNQDIVNQKTKIEDYKHQLLQKFAYVEEQIAKANSVLQLLDAQAKAMER